MPLYTKESIDLLRKRIELPEVIGSYVDLKRVGSTYKALCPFHEEKTASFIIRKGDSHYHCFGCGAHGDAIAFLMEFQNVTFVEALETLAQKFGVVLEQTSSPSSPTFSKRVLQDALEMTSQLYHFLLLYSQEAENALHYLYDRGIDLPFIRKFQIGYAPSEDQKMVQNLLHSKGFSDLAIEKTGLVSVSTQGTKRDFFSERITFPIRDGLGNVIGFSARKFKETTFGGKYINSPETPLFKKSHVLFGLSYSRKRIIKEKKVLIVEGQIDCLRLIEQGFDWAVAGQGTAFGEGHIQQLLQLGVQSAVLALDGDSAGEEAAVKIGDLIQRKGIEVLVIALPPGQDPDTLLRSEGKKRFEELLENPLDYLSFLVRKAAKENRLKTPTAKQQFVQELVEKIEAWEKPVLVHETLRKLAELMQLPLEVVTVKKSSPSIVMRQNGAISLTSIDADKILETDLLRLLFVSLQSSNRLIGEASRHIKPEDLKVPICKRLYQLILQQHLDGQKVDLLTCAAGLETQEEESLISEMMNRKINPDKIEPLLLSTSKKILERNWLEEREKIKQSLYSGSLSEEESLELAKQFDALNKHPPKLDP